MSDDLYVNVTARIVSALEAGVAPWIRPWSTTADTLPMNAGTRRPYRGVNFVLLTLEAQAQGYPLQRWVTYREALELGGQVRKGERGTTIVYWQLKRVAAVADVYPDRDEPNLPDKVYPLLRAFTVFNTAQVHGLPPSVTCVDTPTWEPESRAENLMLMSGVQISHGGFKAFYQPSTDSIQLPPRSAFATAHQYYGTALHELTHATAHPSRCAREFGLRFGDDAYAAEELVAELGAAFLCAHCRIDGKLEHASYLSTWLRVLRADRRAIVVAASRAQQAADFILNLAQPTEANALAA
jgi:antirestriction protein ArdC